ncbi:unnamed protein product [Linum trigynum]|uniref:F-box domain-containing protein n=1 Tax=Linum trigynum TaxID=586398 RepID=A0AAV2DQG6_9ROSI
MNISSSSCDLGKTVKKCCEEDSTINTTDRLTHLPEFIIHHIISFLDTKSAVQTSVLSRAWRSTWKHISVLDFESYSFKSYSSFGGFVENVLSLRCPSNVVKVTYYDNNEDEEVEEEEGEGSLCGKIIKYALSRDTQHLVISLHYIMDVEDSYRFCDLFGTILDSKLKTLDLCSVQIDSGFGCSGFRLLTALEVGHCVLASDQDGDFDPFSGFPCLQDLVLSHCDHDGRGGLEPGRLKVSGGQLLNLMLEEVWAYKMEIFAPRLKFFSLQHDLNLLKFSKLTFPSLDHAVIRINDSFGFLEGNKECVTQSFICLFQGLSNISSLKLDPFTIELLSNTWELLEQERPPFTRLKSLIVRADNIPYLLSNYLLKGSSSIKPILCLNNVLVGHLTIVSDWGGQY